MTSKYLVLLIALFLCLFGVNAATSTAQELEYRTTRHNGFDRSYHLHIPENYDAAAAVPLYIAMHPSASSGQAMAVLTGLNAAADAQNFIVAYPNSLGIRWLEDPARSNDILDDVGFIERIIDEISADYAVDEDRIYMTGFGTGGLMTYQAACAIPERFAGVAIVGALMHRAQAQQCNETDTPTSMLIIYSTNDIYYPTTGNDTTLGDEATANFWTNYNGCVTEDAQVLEETPVILYSNCENNTTLSFYAMFTGVQLWARQADNTLNQIGIDTTEIITRFLSGDETWIEATAPLTLEDPARSYTLYVPTSYTPDEAMPLVIGLHGRSGNGVSAASGSNMNAVAEREGFIGLYPDGINQEWNYLNDIPYFPEDNPDDTEFLIRLIADLSNELNIDQERIYVYGISNGGFMTMRLACEAPQQFAAFMSVIANAFAGMDALCENQPPVAMMLVNGTSDPIVPWDGLSTTQNGEKFQYIYSVPTTLVFWAEHSECGQEYDDIRLPQLGYSPETNIRHWHFPNCAEGGAMEFYAVVGGGHTWPGVDWHNEQMLGTTNFDMQTEQVMWKFFQQHKRDLSQMDIVEPEATEQPE